MQDRGQQGEKRKFSKKRREKKKKKRFDKPRDQKPAEDRHEIGAGDLEDDDDTPKTVIDQDHESPDALHALNVDKKDRIIQPKRFKNITNQSKRLIIVLERANLEVIKTKTSFELLNTDDHQNYIRKFKKDPQLCRPDILHQS